MRKSIETSNTSSISAELQLISNCFEQKMNVMSRKLTGSYYTPIELTDVMMRELVESMPPEFKTDLPNKRLLEPCVGTGNFIFGYLNQIATMSFSRAELKKILENIYVCDINESALLEFKKSLKTYAKRMFEIDLDEDYFKVHIGGGLLFDVNSPQPSYIPLNSVFSDEIIQDGFDIVVTNPPYKNLKAEIQQYSNNEEYDFEKQRYALISRSANQHFKYAADGVLNLYKLFIEEILEKYTNENGLVSLLIPASILTDKTCLKLRTRFLEKHSVKSVKVIRENNRYIDANQALCAMLIHKNKPGDKILMTKDYSLNPQQITSISYQDILNKNTGNAIFALTSHEYTLLKKLQKFPVVKDFEFIKNLRGELDLTAQKEYITSDKTAYPLLRGKNIGYYTLTRLPITEYIAPEFMQKSSKSLYISKERIACQQIANIQKERRVTFSYVSEDFVLANSCNFITVSPNEYGIDLYFILGLFNSSTINWYFKLLSSNNHVNNYEIDGFPIPVNSIYKDEISNLAKLYLKEPKEEYLLKIDDLVSLSFSSSVGDYTPSKRIQKPKKNNIHSNDLQQTLTELFKADEIKKVVYEEKRFKINIESGNPKSTMTKSLEERYLTDISYLLPELTTKDCRLILAGSLGIESYLIQYGNALSEFDKSVCLGITTKYQKMSKGQILNHTTFKLSDLDLEMIRSIPQGGNWKNIPLETVKKSQRLMQIAKNGGRTTLYGRIDYTKPSYTITTYFNRPGNGTYVHPVHNRVISVREAARFQSFQDDYYFYGVKKNLLNQVGNAVPPLLAYQIAIKIAKLCNCHKSIDLFCGAGGMAVGFKEAGICSILGNDIDQAACTTLKLNNPEMEVICGDVTTAEIKDLIVKRAKDAKIDVICGGPPCQGFSMAGFRLLDDPRNQLFKEFVDIVSRVMPKVIVFENVEGILTFQNGEVYRQIHELFGSLGYNTKGKLLLTSNYAVPQKRKRVIVICTRADLDIQPDALYPEMITENISNQISAYEAISDLEDVDCADNATYNSKKRSKYLELMQKRCSFEDFITSIKNKK